jgi:hypothetical protein
MEFRACPVVPGSGDYGINVVPSLTIYEGVPGFYFAFPGNCYRL